MDSEPQLRRGGAGRLTLERYGVTGFTWEQHTRFIGIGTRETLEILRAEHGIKATLEATGLGARLTVRASSEDVGRSKPEPDVFLEAARLLGAAPADCVVVEDSAPGVEAARRAGMRRIAVPRVPDAPDGQGDASGQGSDAAFASAGLLFPGGQREFDAPGRLRLDHRERQLTPRRPPVHPPVT